MHRPLLWSYSLIPYRFQWRIQGEPNRPPPPPLFGRSAAPAPLFFFFFFWPILANFRARHRGIWIPAPPPPPLSQILDPPLVFTKSYVTWSPGKWNPAEHRPIRAIVQWLCWGWGLLGYDYKRRVISNNKFTNIRIIVFCFLVFCIIAYLIFVMIVWFCSIKIERFKKMFSINTPTTALKLFSLISWVILSNSVTVESKSKYFWWFGFF